MKVKVLSFKNQLFYIGIDVHLKSWTVTIRTSGVELKTFKMDPVPEQLAAYLSKMFPEGIYKTVYEAGFCGFWIHHKLAELGINNIVIHPADVPTTQKEKQQKCDPRDSRKLARELESGHLEPIYVFSVEDQTLKSLCRLRISQGKDLTVVKNRICSYVHLFGQAIPEETRWTGAFVEKLYILSERLPNGETLKHLANSLKRKKLEILETTRDLRKAIRRSSKGKLLKLLLTIPGVGFITAATLITEISDIYRFRNFNTLASFVGLIPSTTSSAEKEKVMGLTKRRNKFIQRMLIEASWVAVRKDPVLLKSFTDLTKRMKKQEAIIKIAKKLLNRIKAVWLNQLEYKICYID
jgi:transposase